MTEHDEANKRITHLEETTVWLKDRLWFGTGNLHDRVHKLEDRSADRTFEIDKLKDDVKQIENVIGMGGYGDKNLISDVRDMISTVNKLKDNVITVKDFQTLLNDVKTLKERGQAQLSFWNYLQMGTVMAVISILLDLLRDGLMP